MIEEYLDPEYLPEVLPHRENEISAIFELLKPIIDGRRPINVFIYGPAGIGKTAVAKFVLRKFREEGVKGIYINCWYYRTEGAILAEFLRQMDIPMPRKGRSIDEFVREFRKAVEGLRCIVVLDEIDSIENESPKLIPPNIISWYTDIIEGRINGMENHEIKSFFMFFLLILMKSSNKIETTEK